MDVNEKTVIATSTTASGNIKKLILNILAIKNSLVECGHNSIIIDISKNFVKIDGKEYFLSNNGNGNSNRNGNGNGNDNDNNNNTQVKSQSIGYLPDQSLFFRSAIRFVQ